MLISEYPGYSLIRERITAREKHYSLVGYMLTVNIYFLLFNQSAHKVLFTCLANTKDYYLKKKRERAYKQIEEKLGTERAVIKAKITSLRQRWQLLRSFACTTQQVPKSANNSQHCCAQQLEKYNIENVYLPVFFFFYPIVGYAWIPVLYNNR